MSAAITVSIALLGALVLVATAAFVQPAGVVACPVEGRLAAAWCEEGEGRTRPPLGRGALAACTAGRSLEVQLSCEEGDQQ